MLMWSHEKESGGSYSRDVLNEVVETWKELGRGPGKWRRKIRNGQVPPEIDLLFANLEKQGRVVNEIPLDELRGLLRQHLSTTKIDRGSDLDERLVKSIGWKELVQWRQGQRVSDETLHKIQSVLRSIAIPHRPRTKAEQNPRAGFLPKVDYHRPEESE